MKKSTIWLLTILMALTFSGLLFVEIRYVDDMVKMRNDQFAEGVYHSLFAVGGRLEQDETRHYLDDDINEISASTVVSQFSDELPHVAGFSYEFTTQSGVEGKIEIRGNADQINNLRNDVATLINRYNDVPGNLSPEEQDSYRYRKSLIDEVIIKISSQASSRPVSERVDSVLTRKYITEELEKNGLKIPFEFAVVNSGGIPVYATGGFPSDIESVETDSTKVFLTPLFPGDPANKRIYLKVYFPTKDRYVFDSMGFLLPAFIFTMVLMIVFVYTIILAFRQKRIGEIKNDFINNMTHEFKTPISTISLAGQMLNDDSVRKSPAMMQHISQVINDETKRLRFQVEKVLQMSMFDRRQATVRLKEIDANSAIDQIVNTFKIKVERFGGHIESNLDAEDAIVNVDEMHFTNIIFNLLDNAVKYRREDTPPVLKVSTADLSDNRLKIIVEDNGIGIKREHLKKIFDKFYRVPTGNQHDVKGFGLGLAYVSKMVGLFGGTIKAESEVGSGTRFEITLPLATT